MRLRIETHDRQLAEDLKQLLGSPGDSAPVGVSGGPRIEFEGTARQLGASAPEVVNIILGTALGYSASLVARWLSRQLSGRATRVSVDGEAVEPSEDGLSAAIAARAAEMVGGDTLQEAVAKLTRHWDLLASIFADLDGKIGEMANAYELGSAIGLSRSDVTLSVYYWEGRGYIRVPGTPFMDRTRVCLTSEGIGVCEDAGFPTGAIGLDELPSGVLEDAGLEICATVPACVFRRSGDFWILRYDGATVHAKHTKGMLYLSFLLRHQGQTFEPLELLQRIEGNVSPRAAESPRGLDLIRSGDVSLSRLPDAGPVSDEQAVDEYGHRLRELVEDEAGARERNDSYSLEKILTEKDAIEAHLSEALGIGGRHRMAASDYERVRVCVYNNISRARKRIGKHHPALRDHLTASIITRGDFTYSPEHPVEWTL